MPLVAHYHVGDDELPSTKENEVRIWAALVGTGVIVLAGDSHKLALKPGEGRNGTVRGQVVTKLDSWLTERIRGRYVVISMERAPFDQ